MENNKFYDAIEKEANIITTENGALSFKSTLNKNLDFFAQASAKRGDEKVFEQLFEPAFLEDYDLALKNLFYLRDIREGNGERQIFRDCLEKFFKNFKKYNIKVSKESIRNFLKLIPEYGRWDDLIELNTFSGAFENIKIGIIKYQISKDMKNALNGKPVSLLAKWFPILNNVSNPERAKIAKKLCYKVFNGDFKKARRIIGDLRAYIDITEKKMSANKWNDIDYSKVPSRASMLYRNAFRRHDSVRYDEYIVNVKSGKEKINSKVLEPYEIVRDYCKLEMLDDNEYDPVLEELWKAIPTNVNTENGICVVDVSGSMCYHRSNLKPIDVAISLGIYFAERNPTKCFRNKFITFSTTPSFVSLENCHSLNEKINKASDADWGGNTDICAVFELILAAAKKNNLKNSDMPKNIFIISDMQFNACCYFGVKKSIFETIKEKYRESGYDMPSICFWNVAAREGNLPVLNDAKNVTLLSGFSKNNFKFCTEGKTPLEMMKEVLLSDRYKNVMLS